MSVEGGKPLLLPRNRLALKSNQEVIHCINGLHVNEGIELMPIPAAIEGIPVDTPAGAIIRAAYQARINGLMARCIQCTAALWTKLVAKASECFVVVLAAGDATLMERVLCCSSVCLYLFAIVIFVGFISNVFFSDARNFASAADRFGVLTFLLIIVIPLAPLCYCFVVFFCCEEAAGRDNGGRSANAPNLLEFDLSLPLIADKLIRRKPRPLISPFVQRSADVIEGSIFDAATQGDERRILALVASEHATVNDRDPREYGQSPLHAAVIHGHCGCAGVLLQLKANVHARNNGGATPLHKACLYGHSDCVRLLIDAEADVLAATKSGFLPLHYAATQGSTVCVDMLLRAQAHASASTTSYSFTPLHYASNHGHQDCVGLLVGAGADVNAANDGGATPLHYAAFHGQLGCIQELLSAGANVHVTSKTGAASLHYAANQGNTACVRALLGAGANANIETFHGCARPLHYAVFRGHAECCRALIEAGADVNSVTQQSGASPLHFASDKGHFECVKELLGAGAFVDAETNDGNTACEIAANRGHVAVVALLTDWPRIKLEAEAAGATKQQGEEMGLGLALTRTCAAGPPSKSPLSSFTGTFCAQHANLRIFPGEKRGAFVAWGELGPGLACVVVALPLDASSDGHLVAASCPGLNGDAPLYGRLRWTSVAGVELGDALEGTLYTGDKIALGAPLRLVETDADRAAAASTEATRFLSAAATASKSGGAIDRGTDSACQFDSMEMGLLRATETRRALAFAEAAIAGQVLAATARARRMRALRLAGGSSTGATEGAVVAALRAWLVRGGIAREAATARAVRIVGDAQLARVEYDEKLSTVRSMVASNCCADVLDRILLERDIAEAAWLDAAQRASADTLLADLHRAVDRATSNAAMLEVATGLGTMSIAVKEINSLAASAKDIAVAAIAEYDQFLTRQLPETDVALAAVATFEEAKGRNDDSACVDSARDAISALRVEISELARLLSSKSIDTVLVVITDAVSLAHAESRAEVIALASLRAEAAATKVKVRALEVMLSNLSVIPGVRPSLAELTARLDSCIETFHDANERFADACHELSKAEMKAKRTPAAAATDLVALQDSRAATQRELQRAQRAVESERALLATLASGPFPELLSTAAFGAGGAAYLDPELGAVLVTGRTRAMYVAEPWPAAAAPVARSRHEVGLFRFGEDGELVVLKTVNLGDASAARALKRMVAAVRRLSGHANVAGIDAVFVETDDLTGRLVACLQSRFFPRGSLATYLVAPEVLPPRLGGAHGGVVDRQSDRAALIVVPCLRQVLSALAAAHAKGVIHGDVKLANVLVEESGSVALADFDLAQVDDSEGSARAAAAAMTTRVGAGTPLFMAPELIAGGAATTASDVFAFGVCVLLALAPGLASAGAPLVIVRSQRLAEADPDLAAFLAAALDSDPAERPDAVQLLEHPLFALRPDAAAAAEREVEATSAKRTCCICADELPNAQRGVECSDRSSSHFTCGECLQGFVEAKIGAEGFGRFAAAMGKVFCPVPGCGAAPLSLAHLARALPEGTQGALEVARAKVTEQRAIAALEADFALRLKVKEAEWAALGAEEGARRARRTHVVERLLNLACPRCGQVFTDFDGCFALTCSRDHAAFCAYCLEDCGVDAHRHVAHCPLNIAPGKSVFASALVFEESQQRRRRRLLRGYLLTLTGPEKKTLLVDVAVELSALGIDQLDL